MRVLYKTYFTKNKLSYTFSKDTVKASIQVYLGEAIDLTPLYYLEEDTFDFTGTSDGEAADIVTEIGMCPILKAERVNGELQLILAKFVDEPLSMEMLYPKWQLIE